MDLVLMGLMDELRSGESDPESAVRALADHLPDASPGDRAEVLRMLTFGLRALRSRHALLRSERLAFSARRELLEHSGLSDDYVVARLTEEVGPALLRAIEPDRVYAVRYRLRSVEEPPEWFRRTPGPARRRTDLEVFVSSMDGGAVRTISSPRG